MLPLNFGIKKVWSCFVYGQTYKQKYRMTDAQTHILIDTQEYSILPKMNHSYKNTGCIQMKSLEY